MYTFSALRMYPSACQTYRHIPLHAKLTFILLWIPNLLAKLTVVPNCMPNLHSLCLPDVFSLMPNLSSSYFLTLLILMCLGSFFARARLRRVLPCCSPSSKDKLTFITRTQVINCLQEEELSHRRRKPAKNLTVGQ